MKAAVEEIQNQWQRLITLAQGGEEIVITRGGQDIARITGIPATEPVSVETRNAWLARLEKLRESTSSGKSGPTSEQILEELREERN